MSEWKEFSAKTVDEAINNALVELETTRENLEYEVIEKESSGILGLFSKPAVIRASKKLTLEDIAIGFLSKVFKAMNIEASIEVAINEEENVMNIEFSGEDMGPLIGKRGATLDSLQYLTSLVVNKETDGYMKVKLDTENYRARRKETLENLAKNIAHKVIHSALQNDKYVETHSEGEEPYRKVVITLKPGVDTGYERRGKYSYGGGRSYNRNGGGYRKKRYGDSSYKKREYNADRNVNESGTGVEDSTTEE